MLQLDAARCQDPPEKARCVPRSQTVGQRWIDVQAVQRAQALQGGTGQLCKLRVALETQHLRANTGASRLQRPQD